MKKSEFPPTAELILEVLAARYRLGEDIWSFLRFSSVLQYARRLENSGYIKLHSGQTSVTFRASLTEKGKEYILDKDYVPPILKVKKKKYIAFEVREIDRWVEVDG